MKKVIRQHTLAIALLLTPTLPVLAEEDPAALCQSAAKLYGEGDLDGALEEAKWCYETLQQKKQDSQSNAFLPDVNGWKRGELNSAKAMGINTIETIYEKGERSIDAQLIDGQAGLGAIMQMGLGAAGGKKVRIQRKTAALSKEGGSHTLRVMLDNGKLLQFSTSSASEDELIKFAEALPLKDFE